MIYATANTAGVTNAGKTAPPNTTSAREEIEILYKALSELKDMREALGNQLRFVMRAGYVPPSQALDVPSESSELVTALRTLRGLINDETNMLHALTGALDIEP